NQNVTEAIQKVAATYDCKIVKGVLNHQLKQFVIDEIQVVLSMANLDTRVDDVEFEENELYATDIVTSTEDGKPKLLDEKQTTIYKRAVYKNYHLKIKSFTDSSLVALEEKHALLGLVECVNYELLQPYHVLHEKPTTKKGDEAEPMDETNSGAQA
ncbi:ERBB-3 binding protein 1, partial [Tanacetum coccineum]